MRCPEMDKEVVTLAVFMSCTYIAHIYPCILQAGLVIEDEVRELADIQLCVSVGIEEFPHLMSHQPAHSQEQKLSNMLMVKWRRLSWMKTFFTCRVTTT